MKHRRTKKECPKSATRGARLCFEIGERIREARERLGVSLTILSYHLGVSSTLVLRWEQGVRWPKIVDILELARLLDRPVNYFLSGVDGPSEVEALLELGIIRESDLMAAQSLLNRRRNGETDPLEPLAWDREGLGDMRKDYPEGV